jgi:putative ABC transport system ATP-binding protein
MKIILDNVGKTYGDKIVINKFSYVIEDKSFVTFFGKSGSGKTTLLNLLGTIDKLTSGKITYELDGNRIDNINMIRKNIGFVFQNYALIETKSVKDNLKMSVLDRKWKQDELDNSIKLALGIVKLNDVLDKKVYQLSGGEQQRVSIARAILRNVDTIIADEPTGNLDDENADIIIEIFTKLNKMGKTIIVVSHDVDFRSISKEVVNLY